MMKIYRGSRLKARHFVSKIVVAEDEHEMKYQSMYITTPWLMLSITLP